jgi:hypothetical protein
MLKLHAAMSFLRCNSRVNKFPALCSLPYSQQPTTSSYLFNIQVYIIRPSTARSFNQAVPFKLFDHTLYIFSSPMRATCSASLILLHLVTLNTGILRGVQIINKIFPGSCYCLQLKSNMFLNTLFSNAP